MAIIDAQVHAYERNHPGRPWVDTLHGPPQVTGDDMVAAMDAVGVDGALLVSPWTLYRYDPSYAIDCRNRHPGRFALITPMDPRRPDVADEVRAWAAVPGAVGVRLMLWRGAPTEADDPGLNAVLEAAGQANLPVCMLGWGRLPLIGELAARHPGTTIVLDHLGLSQPFEPPPPPEPFAALPDVSALAAHPNLVVKVTGACTLSHEPFPFADLWEPLGRLFDAFGIERCLWGTDWTRATALVTYQEATDAFRVTDRLTAEEKAQLMGGNVERVFGWSPSAAS